MTVVGDEFGYDGFVLDNGPGLTIFETLIVADSPEEDAFLVSVTLDVTSPNGNPTRTIGVGELIYEAPVDPAP